MDQTRLVSAIETALNVLSGFFISLSVWIFVVAPLFGLPVGVTSSLAITSIFTVTSLIRSYVIRRFFNNGWNMIAVNLVTSMRRALNG